MRKLYLFALFAFMMAVLSQTAIGGDLGLSPVVNLEPEIEKYESGVILLKIYDRYADRNLSFDKEAGTNGENGIAGLSALYQEFGVTSVERLFAFAVPNPELPHDLSTCYEIKYDSGRDAKEVAARFALIAEVEFAEPDFIAQMTLQANDPDASKQTYLSSVNAFKAWDITTCDATQVIGIIDTGVDIGHVDLLDNIYANEAEINGTVGIDDDGNGFVDDFHGWDFVNKDNLPMDDNSHGTHVAGIAAAKTNNGIGIAGIAWNARILPIKVLQSSGRGSYSDVAKGVVYASLNGATVINMSLGGYAESALLRTALENAYHYSFLVAAAGNDGLGITIPDCGMRFPLPSPHFPACYSFVMGVQAFAQWSNYDCTGPYKAANGEGYNYEVKYPGSSIYSTVPGNQYKTFSGTSMASPIVAGAAALLKSHFPNISHEEMFARLIEGGKDIEKALTINLPPELKLASFNVLDTLDGDRDGIPDAGETIQLQVTLQNFGFQAYNIQAKLRLSEYEDKTTCIIIDSTSSMNNASAYAKVDNWDNTFEIKIPNDIANNRDIVFEVEFTCANSTEKYKDKIVLTAQRGVQYYGFTSGVTHLTADKYYIFPDNVVFDTLIVDPGTELNISHLKQIVVDDLVVSNGTPDSLITLQRNGTGTYHNGIQSKGEKLSSSYLKIQSANFHYFSNKLTNSFISESYSAGGVISHLNFCTYTKNNSMLYDITNTVVGNNNNIRGIYCPTVAKLNSSQYNSIINEDNDHYYITAGVPWGQYKMPANYLGSIDTNYLHSLVFDFYESSSSPIALLPNILLEPPINAHGHVWKVELDDIDMQDEYEDLEPVGNETRKFDTYFNRAMDTIVTPFLTFGVRSPWTQRAILDSGKWISWKRDSLAGKAIYHLQIAEDAEFANIIWEEDTLECVNRKIAGLDSNGKYFWRVRYQNDGESWNDWSDIYSFTTFRKNVPPAPVLLYPIDGDSALYTDLTIKWEKSEFADSVEIEVATDSGFSNIIRSSKKMNMFCEEVEVENLTKAKTYHWRVRFKNVSGYSDWSSRSFKTYVDSVKAPELLFPYDGMEGLGYYNNHIIANKISWASNYEFQYDDNLDFSSPVSRIREDSVTGFDFTANSTVYLRVRAYNGLMSTKWSDINRITTMKNDSIVKPTLVSTSKNDTIIISPDQLMVALDWNVIPGAYYSYLEVAADVLFTNIVYSTSKSTQKDTSVHWTGFSINQKYYWRVRGKTTTNRYSSWSETHSFTVITDNDDPRPLLCVPSNEARGQKTDSLLLKWNNAPGANTVYDARWQAYYTFDYSTGDGLQRIRVAGAQDNEYFEIPEEDYRFNFEVQATSGASNNFYAQGDVGKIHLAWDKPSDDGWIGFNVYRFVQKSAGKFGDTVMVNKQLVRDSVFTDYTVIPDSAYYYVYRILRSTLEESGDSKVVSAEAFAINLDPPNLLSPKNDTTNLEPSIRFDWDEPSGAQAYIIQISRDELFTDVVKSVNNLNMSEYNAVGLPNNTRLYWKVKAEGVQGTSNWSNVWSFTTKPLLPKKPVLVYPADKATQILTTVTLDWQAADYAITYQVQVSKASNFSNVVFDYTNIGSSSKRISGLTLNTKYYWRVRGKNDAGFGLWSDAPYFTTDAAAYYETPSSWDFVENTGKNASIIISKNLNITIDEEPVEVGDAIGVFYRDGSEKKCAGYAVWTGQNLAIPVWGDDEYTPEKDGFQEMEKYKIMLWDGRGGEEFASKLSFDQGKDYFINNGISYVSFLQSVETETHSIKLAKGWNMISTYVEPELDSMDLIVNDISDDLYLMKNSGGDIYLPSLSINKIPQWIMEEGYLCYMTNEAILDIEGLAAAADYEIQLAKGWNMISYLHDTKQDIEVAFEDIETSLFLAKNGRGAIYLPIYGINQIDTVSPGLGYLVYMNNADSLVYPIPQGGGLKRPANTYTEFETSFAAPNANNATVIIESNLPAGTMIEAYTVAGKLIGSGKLIEGKAVIAIYGDDEYTKEIDGAKEGEAVLFEAITDNIRQNIAVESVSSLLSGKVLEEVRFSNNALYLAKTVSEIPQAGGDLTITPNPAKDEAKLGINFRCSGNITVEIYNLNGELMANAYTGKAVESLVLDTSKLPSGTYQVLLNTNDEVKTIRFVVVR